MFSITLPPFRLELAWTAAKELAAQLNGLVSFTVVIDRANREGWHQAHFRQLCQRGFLVRTGDSRKGNRVAYSINPDHPPEYTLRMETPPPLVSARRLAEQLARMRGPSLMNPTGGTAS